MNSYNTFFKSIGSNVKNNIEYHVYQPYGFPVILKNKFGQVLASLQVFYDDEPIETQTCPIPVPFENGFQIIFQSKEGDTRIESGRPIKYVITNHCNKSGYVKMDLGFNKVPICETDPPENINNVNELHSFELFTIKSNQLDNWKQLIVKTKKVIDPNNTFKTVSLDEETKATAEKKVGSYLYLTVTPQNNEILPELFKETYWSTDEYIVIEKNILSTPISRRNHMNYFLRMEEIDRPFVAAAAPPNFYRAMPVKILEGTLRSPSCDLRSYIPNQKSIIDPFCNSIIDNEDSDNDKYIKKSKDSKTSKAQQMFQTEATNVAQTDIMTSKVAEMVGGKQIIQQGGNKTYVTYDYSVRTEPCKIGMSIMNLDIKKSYSDMTMEEMNNTINNYLQEIEKFKTAEYAEIAKTIKKYRGDVCTMCLGEPPNTILVRCGHICTCSKDCSDMLGDNCPICRAKILCKIDENLFNIN